MKSFTKMLTLLSLFMMGSFFAEAQTFADAGEALDHGDYYANQTITLTNQTNAKLNALGNYLSGNSPDKVYKSLDDIRDLVSTIESFSDEISFAGFRANQFRPDIGAAALQQLGSDIEATEDAVSNFLNQAEANYAVGNIQGAESAVLSAATFLAQIEDLARQARDLSRDLKKAL